MKVAAPRDDLGVARVSRRWCAPAPGGIALAKRRGERLLAEVPEHLAVVVKLPCNNMDDFAVGIPLYKSVDGNQSCSHHDFALPFEDIGPDYEVRNTGFIFDRDENHAFRAALPLPDQHKSSNRQTLAVLDRLKLFCGDKFA